MGLTYDEARRALDAALQKATEIGSPSSIAIVDGGRELIGFARQDEAREAGLSADFPCSMKMATKDIGPLTQPGQPLYGLEHTHQRPLVTFGGGRPLEVDGHVIGGVGVAGGTVDQDDEIAAAAAAALTSRRSAVLSSS